MSNDIHVQQIDVLPVCDAVNDVPVVWIFEHMQIKSRDNSLCPKSHDMDDDMVVFRVVQIEKTVFNNLRIFRTTIRESEIISELNPKRFGCLLKVHDV